MLEYKIIFDTETKAQTMLNQWRHDYDMEILGVSVSPDRLVCIVLRRTKKEV